MGLCETKSLQNLARFDVNDPTSENFDAMFQLQWSESCQINNFEIIRLLELFHALLPTHVALGRARESAPGHLQGL